MRDRKPHFQISICLSSVLIWVAGCTPSAELATSPKKVEAEISADEILQTVLQQYSDATSYQDQAVLYLSYRLEGRAIREPHPWSVAWNRKGQFSANLFNTKLRNDGEALSCYVYDIQTGNIDNQHVLVPGAGFKHILNDKIASHFVFGTSELPLDSIETQTNNRLIQPMFGFMDQTLLPDWLQQPDQLKKLDDDQSLGVDCYVVQLFHDQRIYQIWIDKHSGIIEQIQLPLQFLDSQILAADQVSQLRFVVRFHDAKLNQTIPPERIKIPDRLASKTVRNFVELPEALPSERLGEKISDFKLQTPNGQAFDLRDSKVTALLWVADFNASNLLQQLDQFADELQNPDVDVVAVYSDDLVDTNDSASKKLRSEILQTVSEPSFRLAYDAQLEFGSALLQLKSIPSLVVLDKDKTLQYVQAIDEEYWTEQSKVAVTRVAKSENLWSEMKADYNKFLDEYTQQVAAQGMVKADRQLVKSVSLNDWTQLTPIVAWQNDQLTAPGNIHVPDGSKRIFVLDGSQSVVELDSAGNIVDQIRLDVPADVAINRIRSLTLPDGSLTFVAFSMLGKKAYVFDDNWKPVFKFGTPSGAGITESQLVPNGGKFEAWISCLGESGLAKTNGEDQLSTLLKFPCRSFYKSSTHLYAISQSGFFVDDAKIALGGNMELAGQWNYKYLRPDPSSPDQCFVVAVDEQNKWHIRSVRFDGTTLWAHAVPAQFLDTTVDPVVISNSSRGPVIGLVYDRHVAIVMEDSIEILSNELDNPPTGFSFFNAGEYFALASFGQIVKAYTLKQVQSKIISVSSKASQ